LFVFGDVEANDVVEFHFIHFPLLKVMTDSALDTAVASVEFEIRITAPATPPTVRELLRWFPSAEPPGTPGPTFTKAADEGVVFDTMEPFSLNKAISCTGACMKEYDPGSDAGGEFKLSYRFTQPHESVVVSVDYVNQVFVRVNVVPEPASVSMALSGAFTALVMCARRRRLNPMSWAA
jgi:hypothetical protein